MAEMGNEIELIDLVDTSGTVKQAKIPRPEAENFPNLHMQIAIGVIFDDKRRILVEKRALTKTSEPGKIDHVCGSLLTGETPQKAIGRESVEETGILPQNLKVISKGVNVYKRYQYLLIGEVKGTPNIICSDESEWVKFISPEELKAKEASGELEFVKDFFENNNLALDAIKK